MPTFRDNKSGPSSMDRQSQMEPTGCPKTSVTNSQSTQHTTPHTARTRTHTHTPHHTPPYTTPQHSKAHHKHHGTAHHPTHHTKTRHSTPRTHKHTTRHPTPHHTRHSTPCTPHTTAVVFPPVLYLADRTSRPRKTTRQRFSCRSRHTMDRLASPVRPLTLLQKWGGAGSRVV